MGKALTFKAHKSQLECMELNFSGTKIATASAKVILIFLNRLIEYSKGTIIRVFNVSDGTLAHELRRGSDNAQIFSLAFDSDSKWLACSSDSLTVHIFSLRSNLGK